MIVQTELGI